jgi:hypothetical protein
MALQKSHSTGPKATWLEFSPKAGAFTIGFGEHQEEFESVTGEIVDMYLMDPMKPNKGTPKPNAAEIPVKLVVGLKDGEERYNVTFPLHTNKDRGLTFTAMKAVAQIYGTLFHSFTEKEAGHPNSVRLMAGKSGGAEGKEPQPFLASQGLNDQGEYKHRIEKAWGVKEDGTLDLGVERGEINGRMTYEAPAGFVDTYTQGPQKGKMFVDLDKVLGLVNDMLVPFEAARAERKQQQGQSHSSHDAGIDPESMDEARDSLRQRG